MTTTSATVIPLSNIQRMILQRMKKREINMSSIALAYQPQAISSGQTKKSKENERLLSDIKATSISVEKLKLISDFSNVVDTQIIQQLIVDDYFDSLTRAEILEELMAASA